MTREFIKYERVVYLCILSTFVLNSDSDQKNCNMKYFPIKNNKKLKIIRVVLISKGECSSEKKRDLSAGLEMFSKFLVSFTERVRIVFPGLNYSDYSKSFSLFLHSRYRCTLRSFFSDISNSSSISKYSYSFI